MNILRYPYLTSVMLVSTYVQHFTAVNYKLRAVVTK